ncbi:VOC family protein [Peredibacter sp. HCB2-198]|uniref:VOC family protein n=1 Tax=Peredibacter sp. HCB2-198 TaxID=3383025 RepID=UPI0038B59269
MLGVQSYLIFNGNCEEAMKHYCDVFGGEVQFVMRYKDAPKNTGMDTPATWGEKIMHANFIIRGVQLMASDSHPGSEVKVGNNIQLSANFPKTDKMDDAFNKLSQGGKVTMPLQNTFWGARFGMLVDRFGNSWMFNQDLGDK